MTEDRIIYKVVSAYYEDGLIQKEIGNKYGISRMKVSRILKKLRKGLSGFEPLATQLVRAL